MRNDRRRLIAGITLAAAGGALFVLAGCSRTWRSLESRLRDGDAAPVASASSASSTTPEELVPPNDLHCVGTSCDLTFVTEAAARTLSPRADRDKLRIAFRDGTTQAGFDSIGLIPWVTTVTVADASRIGSIATVAKLEDLGDLELSQATLLTDLSPIEALSSLTTLKVAGAGRLTDLSPLGRPSALASIDLRGLRPASWEFLASMHLLSAVTLANTGIPSADALANVRHLRFLTLMDEKVPTLAPLASLPGFIGLDLYTTSIGDGNALGLLPRMDHLRLSAPYPGEVSIPAIAKLTSLEYLEISKDLELRDIAPLAALVNMKDLYLSGDPGLTRIDALSAMPNLREVGLVGTHVSSLASLAGARHIAFLGVADTAVTSLAPLLGDPDLRNVSVSKTFPEGAIAAFRSQRPQVAIHQ